MNEFDYDVVVVGASFSGLTLCHHLGGQNKILILDAKPFAGSTVESTGLITTNTYNEFKSFFPIDTYITNPISSICVVAPNMSDFFVSTTHEPWIYQTDTRGLVRALAESLDPRIEQSMKTVFLGAEEEEMGVRVRLRRFGKSEETIRTRLLVGADGSHSAVAKAHPSLDTNERFLFGYEQVVPGEVHLGPNPEETIYHFWFGEFSLGYGGWLSPTREAGRNAFRVGLAKLEHDRGDAKSLLEQFVIHLKERGIVSCEGPATYAFGSLIPINPVRRRVSTAHTVLIGDAAGYCGAFAADGIKGSVVSGKVAAELIQTQLQTHQPQLHLLHKKVAARSGLIAYYTRQVRYRWIWDRMKRNRTFEAMWKIINRERDTFLDQFCDSKDARRSLTRTVLKWKHLPLLVPYAFFLFIDLCVPNKNTRRK